MASMGGSDPDDRTARRAALRRAANELAFVVRPADVRAAIAELVHPTVGTDSVAIAVPDGDGGALMTVVTAPGTAFEGRTRTIPLEQHHPITDTMRDGRSRLFRSLEDLVAAYPDLADRARRSGDASWAHIALRHGDRVLGAIGLAFDDARAFDDEDEALYREFAHMCLAASERARLYEAEHSISLALQHGLLAHPTPSVPGVEIATRYVPAYRRLEVGGDWHQAIALPDGRLGLSVGDVVGKGASAASTMGQLRSALAGAAMALRSCPIVDAAHAPLPTTSPTDRPRRPSGSVIA